MSVYPQSSSPPLRRLWWLDPAWLFAGVIGLTMLAAYVQSKEAFELYGTPKFISSDHLALAAVAIAVFWFGSFLAHRTGTVPRADALPTETFDAFVAKCFWLSALLTFLGYAVWLAVGIKNGFRPGMLGEFLFTDDPLLGMELRDNYFATIPGVTTNTQFGAAAVLLGAWLYFRGHKRVFWPTVILILFAASRALVFSERLALVELALPGFIALLRLRVLGRPVRPLMKWSLQLAPIVGLAALVAFFGAFEYFRSWRFYHNDFDSYAEFTLWRVGGYYTTAHNNGAMSLETHELRPLPFSTLRQLWEFPGVRNSPIGYRQLTGIDHAHSYERMLEIYGTPELNNEGGLFQPALDFGIAGFAVFWLLAGFVAGRLFRSFLVGTLTGLTLYPIVFLAILETPRFLYLAQPRSLPTLVMLLGVVAVVWLRASQQPLAVPAPARA